MAPRLQDLTNQQLELHQATDFARYVKCFHAARSVDQAATLFEAHYPRSLSVDVVRRSVELHTKNLELHTASAIAPGDTVNASWAKPLVNVRALVDAFVNVLRPAEVLSQLPGTVRVPIGVPIPVYTPQALTGATLWVGQGLPKRVAAFAFTSTTVPLGKVALITTVTKELLQFGVAGTEGALKTILAAQIIQAVNAAFLDPAHVAIADVDPGSITSAGTSVTSLNDAAKDAAAVLAALGAARPNVQAPTLILDAGAALAIDTTRPPYQRVTLLVTGAAGKTVTAIDPSALLVSDSGLELDMSGEATIVSDSAPTPPDASTVPISLWQRNFVAFKGERLVSWKLTDATAVQYATRA